MLDDSEKTEAAATAAFDQLWKEEEQAVNRATAKKAKKQRQKARKQQNQSLQLFSSPTKDLSTTAFQGLDDTSLVFQAGSMYGADLSSDNNEPSCSNSGPMPVARQLFRAYDIPYPARSNPHFFVQQSSQLGSGVSHSEASFAQRSMADPLSPEPSSRNPYSSTLSNPLSPEGSLEGSPEGSAIQPIRDLSRPQRSSRSQVAKQHPEQTEAEANLAFEPSRASPDLAVGQAADAEAPDAEADFLHTLFSCPITKVACTPCLALFTQS